MKAGTFRAAPQRREVTPGSRVTPDTSSTASTSVIAASGGNGGRGGSDLLSSYGKGGSYFESRGSGKSVLEDRETIARASTLGLKRAGPSTSSSPISTSYSSDLTLPTIPPRSVSPAPPRLPPRARSATTISPAALSSHDTTLSPPSGSTNLNRSRSARNPRPVPAPPSTSYDPRNTPLIPSTPMAEPPTVKLDSSPSAPVPTTYFGSLWARTAQALGLATSDVEEENTTIGDGTPRASLNRGRTLQVPHAKVEPFLVARDEPIGGRTNAGSAGSDANTKGPTGLAPPTALVRSHSTPNLTKKPPRPPLPPVQPITWHRAPPIHPRFHNTIFNPSLALPPSRQVSNRRSPFDWLEHDEARVYEYYLFLGSTMGSEGRERRGGRGTIRGKGRGVIDSALSTHGRAASWNGQTNGPSPFRGSVHSIVPQFPGSQFPPPHPPTPHPYPLGVPNFYPHPQQAYPNYVPPPSPLPSAAMNPYYAAGQPASMPIYGQPPPPPSPLGLKFSNPQLLPGQFSVASDPLPAPIYLPPTGTPSLFSSAVVYDPPPYPPPSSQVQTPDLDPASYPPAPIASDTSAPSVPISAGVVTRIGTDAQVSLQSLDPSGIPLPTSPTGVSTSSDPANIPLTISGSEAIGASSLQAVEPGEVAPIPHGAIEGTFSAKGAQSQTDGEAPETERNTVLSNTPDQNLEEDDSEEEEEEIPLASLSRVPIPSLTLEWNLPDLGLDLGFENTVVSAASPIEVRGLLIPAGFGYLNRSSSPASNLNVEDVDDEKSYLDAAFDVTTSFVESFRQVPDGKTRGDQSDGKQLSNWLAEQNISKPSDSSSTSKAAIEEDVDSLDGNIGMTSEEVPRPLSVPLNIATSPSTINTSANAMATSANFKSTSSMDTTPFSFSQSFSSPTPPSPTGASFDTIPIPVLSRPRAISHSSGEERSGGFGSRTLADEIGIREQGKIKRGTDLEDTKLELAGGGEKKVDWNPLSNAAFEISAPLVAVEEKVVRPPLPDIPSLSPSGGPVINLTRNRSARKPRGAPTSSAMKVNREEKIEEEKSDVGDLFRDW